MVLKKESFGLMPPVIHLEDLEQEVDLTFQLVNPVTQLVNRHAGDPLVSQEAVEQDVELPPFSDGREPPPLNETLDLADAAVEFCSRLPGRQDNFPIVDCSHGCASVVT